LFVTALLAATLVAHPQDPARPSAGPATSTTVTAVRAEQPPRIDGRDDDAVWQRAPKVGDFLQFQPRVDGTPTVNTEFRVAYDEHNLYVFVRMFDPHPDSIMHALSRRDVRGPSDQIKLLIDSYHDRRSGYELAVNPDGVKRDYSMSNDGQEDDSWDGVWDVATTVDSLGWTAEYRVPLSQLRYADAPTHTFGFGIWRDVERYNEREAWPRYSPTTNGLSSQLGQITGLAGLSTGRRLEAIPYVVTKNAQRTLPGGGYMRGQDVTVGGDLKVGITPNVTLDATVNPDFGQVEADPAVLNLSAFETFFSERRPFFVEGAGTYQFALNCYIVVDCSTNEGLFYSRRIGRAPSLSGVYGDAATPTATPIAAATKLTGRTGSGLVFGVLDAVTERVHAIGNETVEPQANYAVVRAQQDLNQGNTSFSVIGTGVNRSLDALSDPYLHQAAYAGGANFRNRFHKGDYEFNAQVAASRVEGTPAMLLRTQTNSVHYYQQPGDHLTVDSNATSLMGHEEQVKFGKYGGGFTRFETSVVRQSAGFDVNDLGYLRRADLLNWSTWGALTWQTQHWIYNWAQVNGNHWIAWNTSGAKFDHGMNFNMHMGLNDKAGFLNRWDVHLGGSLVNLADTRCDRCTRGGPLVRESRGFYPWAGFNSDSRKAISYGSWFNFGWSDAGHSSSASVSPYVTYRASTQLTLTLSTGLSHGNDDAQWFGNFADSATGATHYAFAHLKQSTVDMSVRVNYTATPNLTFEFYGEPFVSTGTYTNVHEVSATPNAAAYADRFQPYTPPAGSAMAFTYSQLRTNAVVRWEYRPGSTLFVVWQHGRQDYENQNLDRPWTSDYHDLLSLHPDNTFLVKLAYWLNR
jgi:hypothetical protein